MTIIALLLSVVLFALVVVLMVKHSDIHTTFLVKQVDARAGSSFKAHLEGDVGYDLEMWIPDQKYIAIEVDPGCFASLPTGLAVKVGDNAWGCIRPRSSTFLKRKMFVMEGTIDSGYTGPLFVNVFNPTNKKVIIRNGERLAQLIPVPKFYRVSVKTVDELPTTQRGGRGFGSTGGIIPDKGQQTVDPASLDPHHPPLGGHVLPRRERLE